MDAIAERRLELRTEGGAVEVVALLGRPKQVGAEEWTCACITKFGSEERSIDIHGSDSMQALQLAMNMLDGELQRGAERRGGELLWFDEPFTSVLENSGMKHCEPSARPQRDAS